MICILNRREYFFALDGASCDKSLYLVLPLCCWISSFLVLVAPKWSPLSRNICASRLPQLNSSKDKCSFKHWPTTKHFGGWGWDFHVWSNVHMWTFNLGSNLIAALFQVVALKHVCNILYFGRSCNFLLPSHNLLSLSFAIWFVTGFEHWNAIDSN